MTSTASEEIDSKSQQISPSIANAATDTESNNPHYETIPETETQHENESPSLQDLQLKAQTLQSSLTQTLESISTVKEEHNKLASENQFLKEYIGNLMSTGNLIN